MNSKAFLTNFVSVITILLIVTAQFAFQKKGPGISTPATSSDFEFFTSDGLLKGDVVGAFAQFTTLHDIDAKITVSADTLLKAVARAGSLGIALDTAQASPGSYEIEATQGPNTTEVSFNKVGA